MGGWLPPFRVLGLAVRVHLLALAVPALLALTAADGADLSTRLSAYGIVVGSVLLHEVGHALAARARRLVTGAIHFHGVGVWVPVERRWPQGGAPADEWAVALAGPLGNLVVAAGVVGAGAALGWAPPPHEPRAWLEDPLAVLLAANALMGAGNLVPVFPADGGRVVRALLAGPLGYARATRATAALGAVAAAVLAAGALLAGTLPAAVLLGVFAAVVARAASVEWGRARGGAADG